MQRKRRGFTLIELLVVISIIALLVSILLPALGNARTSAIQLECLSNVRTLGQAVHMYLADHSQYYPYSLTYYTPGNGYFNDSLNTYLGLGDTFADTLRAKVWHCPQLFPEATVAAWGDPDYGLWAMYAANPHLMPPGDTGGTHNQYSSGTYAPSPGERKNVNEAEIRVSPSELVQITDAFRPTSWWEGMSARTNRVAQSTVIMPHFSRNLMQFQFANPYAGDQIAGGGKGAIVFQDGHAGARGANEWNNLTTGIGTWLLPE